MPAWLAARMTTLGTAISEAVVQDYGRSEFLTRLSDPFWFQAFGSVLGMDWHSSGITTAVMGALKRGLNPRPVNLASIYAAAAAATRGRPRMSSSLLPTDSGLTVNRWSRPAA